ncbi:hypothetical protein [Rhizobium sp. RAF56]|uniref:hypothetical protein n=1 Tax=Rhizobium sp. RAF56 TaxID=3233062 RepID=UPI003F99D6BC
MATEEAVKTAVVLPFLRALGYDVFDPTVAVCYVGGVDIGGEIIKRGGASDCRHFSLGRYAELETNHALPHAAYCGGGRQHHEEEERM